MTRKKAGLNVFVGQNFHFFQLRRQAQSAERGAVCALGLHLLGVKLVRYGWHRNVKFGQLYKNKLEFQKTPAS